MSFLVSLQWLHSSPGACSPFVARYPSESHLASELPELGNKLSSSPEPPRCRGGWKRACPGECWQRASPVCPATLGALRTTAAIPCRQPSLFNQAFNQSALGTKHGPEEQMLYANIFRSFRGDSFFVQPVFHEEEKATQILPGKGGVKIQITTIKIIPNYLSGKLKMTIVINNFGL